MRHAIIKVGATHHGPIPPGIMVVVEEDKVTVTSGKNVTFENPVVGGFSFGELVCHVVLP